MRTIRTVEARAAFLKALAECGNATDACLAAGIGRRSAYDWKDDDEAFAADWEEALEEGTDALEREARRRAVEGVDEPVFYQGQQVATVKRKADALLVLLLKANRPHTFRERMELSGDPARPLNAKVALIPPKAPPLEG